MLGKSLSQFLLVLDHIILVMLLVVSIMFILSILGSDFIQSQLDRGELWPGCASKKRRLWGGRYSQCNLCCCGGGCACDQQHIHYDIVWLVFQKSVVDKLKCMSFKQITIWRVRRPIRTHLKKMMLVIDLIHGLIHKIKMNHDDGLGHFASMLILGKQGLCRNRKLWQHTNWKVKLRIWEQDQQTWK